MAVFSVGSQAALGCDAGEACVNLWNPAANTAIRVRQIEVVHQAALTNGIRLSRTSTIGTTGTSITPDADNHFGRRAAPQSACVMYLGNFSVNPTEETPSLFSAQLGAGASGGMVGWWFPEPIVVPAGSGLGIYSVGAGTSFGHFWEWEE